MARANRARARGDAMDADDDASRSRARADANRRRRARRRLDEAAAAGAASAIVDGARRAIARATTRALDALGALERGAMKVLGHGAGWIAVCAPAEACACAAGAYGGAACALGACALGAALALARGPTRAVRDVVIGMAMSVLPAALTATTRLSRVETGRDDAGRRADERAERGRGERGRDVGRGTGARAL